MCSVILLAILLVTQRVTEESQSSREKRDEPMRKDEIHVKVHFNSEEKLIASRRGKNLLRLLQEHKYEIYSPCGGNGTCGKCKVFLKDEGYITSCGHTLVENVEIILPDKLEGQILASQYEYSRILPLSPGNFDHLSSFPMGVAIDIGTTTIVFHLTELLTGVLVESRSIMNPQGKYGADVVSRINYTISNQEGLQVLHQEIIEAINRELIHFADYVGIRLDDIVKITVAGNTTMLHLLLGVDPKSLAFIPFTPVFTDKKILAAKDLNLVCNAESEIHILPSLAAYIGADILAGIASLAPKDEIQNYLFIDVGTNGEMALITPEHYYCCATAAGPAFEGANIQHGMAAVQGAINTFGGREDFTTIGGVDPVGICGSGLIDIVAVLIYEGIIAKDGNMDADYLLVKKEYSGNGYEIALMQKDVREIQLAKSAIASGIKILIKEAGLTYDQLDALYLAGGFGNYIHNGSAIRIGLLPAELRKKIIPVGNTSGSGALLSLKSGQFDDIIYEFKERMEYVELAEKEDFMMEFALNMEFPVIE